MITKSFRSKRYKLSYKNIVLIFKINNFRGTLSILNNIHYYNVQNQLHHYLITTLRVLQAASSIFL